MYDEKNKLELWNSLDVLFLTALMQRKKKLSYVLGHFCRVWF